MRAFEGEQACTDVAELSVIIILALGAITTAGWTVLQLARLTPSDVEDQRLSRALQSAADGLAQRQFKLLLGALVGEGVVSLGLLEFVHGTFSWWIPLGLLTGTGAVFALAQLSVNLSLNVASAAGRLVGSGDSAVVLNLRSASAVVLLSGALSVLLGAGALAAVRLGETTSTLALLEGIVIGGSYANLLLHATGASLRVAGVTSRASAIGASKHPFYGLDSANPSLVLDLVAQHTGSSQGPAQRVFWVMSLQQVFALLVAQGSTGIGDALLSIVLVTQSVSLIGAGVIQLALRTSEGVRSWTGVLSHGLIATNVMTLVALVGATYWLLGVQTHIPELLCAALGAILTWTTVVLPGRNSARQNRRLEDHQDNQRRPVLDLGFALPHAFVGMALHFGTVCISLLALSYLTPEPTHLADALWWWCSGALISLPYLAAQDLLEPLTESTASLAALRLDAGRGEPHAQLSSMCSVGQQAGSGSQRWFSVITCLLATLGIGYLSRSAAASPELVSHAFQGLLGVALVVGALGVIARRVSTTAQSGLNEVARHQRTEDGSPPKPSYAHYVEVITGHALHRGVWMGTLLMLAIWTAAMGSSTVWGSTSSVAPSPPPTTLLAFAATAGITVSLLGVGIASFLGATRGFRRVASGSSQQASDSLNTAHLGFAELAGKSLAPGALVLVHLIMAVILAATPSPQ